MQHDDETHFSWILPPRRIISSQKRQYEIVSFEEAKFAKAGTYLVTTTASELFRSSESVSMPPELADPVLPFDAVRREVQRMHQKMLTDTPSVGATSLAFRILM